MTSIIKITDLEKTYKGNTEKVLKKINLEIQEGEFFGLLGPNAAGKTTLISVICGLLVFQKGSVIVNGIDVKKNPRKLNTFIGLVPQEIALFPSLTVKENIEFFGHMYKIPGDILKKNMEYYIETLQLGPHLKKRISKCSGGIKRRVNLVSGLIHNPKILFLDEPTLGVDAQSMNLIYEYLKNLNSKGTTLIYTTHYMKEAENLCTRITIIDDGNVIAQGTPKELIDNNPGCSDLGQVFLKLTGKELRE